MKSKRPSQVASARAGTRTQRKNQDKCCVAFLPTLRSVCKYCLVLMLAHHSQLAMFDSGRQTFGNRIMEFLKFLE